jgi:hypothetical protein
VDLNVRAFRVVQAALSEPTVPDKRKESARKGGLAGGVSRAKSISAERRTEIAKQASTARWKRRADTADAVSTMTKSRLAGTK